MHVMAAAVVVLVFAATEVVARAVVADAVVLVVMVVPDTGSKHAVAPAAMGGAGPHYSRRGGNAHGRWCPGVK